jgi:hypothetical protein
MACSGCAKRRAAMKKKAISLIDKVRREREAKNRERQRGKV